MIQTICREYMYVNLHTLHKFIKESKNKQIGVFGSANIQRQINISPKFHLQHHRVDSGTIMVGFYYW